MFCTHFGTYVDVNDMWVVQQIQFKPIGFRCLDYTYVWML